MLKRHKTCNVCKAITGNTVLLNRIYNSAFFMKRGEALNAIAKDYKDKFKYENLLNHVKKHQFLSDDDFTERHLREISRNAERAILKQTIESKQVWDKVIDLGMERLEEGELHIKAGDLLKAAKDKSDFQFKVKDQEMAMMEMVYHFASGENNRELSNPYDRRVIEGQKVENNDATEGAADNLGPGAYGSNPVYYPPSWDASPPGTDPLPSGNDTSQNAY